MTATDIQQQNITETFLEAERSGLRVAIRVRIAALFVLGGFMVLTRISNLPHALELALAVTVFAGLGLVQYFLIGSRYDRPWTKYLFVAIDFALLSVLIATQPLYPTVDVPQTIMFRTAVFPFYFLVLGMAAFSLSPGLVIWSGVAGVLGWTGAFLWAIRDMPERLGWFDIGANPTKEKFLSIFLSPNFVGGGNRVQESFVFIVVALLIAAVIWRARKTAIRQLELDEERRAITEVFAQYVPEKIADALIADRGLLAPVERTATVLFIDIAGFTAMTERVGPQRTVSILNDFFDKATNCISDNQGVVTQFIGDGIMATFNTPVEDPDHERHAVKAARQILELVDRDRFDEQTLSIRVGICTGPVIGGSVGGGGRQCYTVYGDTVNLASRLEILNKDHDTNILISASTVTAMDPADFRQVGQIDVRGLAEPVSVFTISEAR